jgi:ABC-2 type transport system ATP-binding protein
VISVDRLTKRYGELLAVDNASFSVYRGEVFGLLGENGAGKTTTLEMIEGLRRPTSGTISVLGHEVGNGSLAEIKERVGVQLQSSAYFHLLSLTEILDLFGSFYSKHVSPEKLLAMVHLQDKARSYVSKLSGGQKQRFSIVASLVNDPEIVFLDEPTTGLDPLARRNLWDLVFTIKQHGKTVILTTHYMEEAETLCDRVAIMDEGKIISIGETHKLVEQTEMPFRIEFLSANADGEALDDLRALGSVTSSNARAGQYEVALKTRADLDRAIQLVQSLHPKDLTVGRATLEDLFIELTGKTIGDDNA